ncbi:MAG TPA: DUF1887 family protein [Candidatus Scybalocola faecipullorum]|nr:DUF1887 family protein [Candidatus Scybalocola faecipullorum]
MKILIEFYDRSVLKNMVAALSLQPDYLTFFYDKEMFDTFEIYSTYLACKKYLPALKFELRSVDYHDYPMIESKIGQYILDNCDNNICIDLTGGSELMTIAGYNAGKNANVQVFFSDIYKSEVVRLTQNGPKYRSLPFTLEDIIEAGGGKLSGFTPTDWLTKHKKELYAMSKKVLASPKAWSDTCRFFQKTRGQKTSNPLHFEVSLNHTASNAGLPDKRMLYSCQSCRLIQNLLYTKQRLSFDFTFRRAAEYMSSYGVWLELFSYYEMLKIPKIRDVKTSIKIDWNRRDDIEIIGNEVDVTAMYGCRPVVVSCKQSTNPVSADALNELYVVARRIGGKYSIPILITRSDIKHEHSGIYMKAREMKMHVLDASDILSQDFCLRLGRIISEN